VGIRSALLICSLVWLAACAPASTLPTPRADQPLPQAPVERLDGSQTTLGAALGGKIALVTLWATWCETCRDELAPLAKLAPLAEARGARVIAVDVGEPGTKVAAFVASHRIPYPQLVDPRYRFSDALGGRRVPTTLVVDHSGRIVYAGGALDEAALSALRRALGPESASR
jgi:peroxiredoxin